jgi:hypothetical protein
MPLDGHNSSQRAASSSHLPLQGELLRPSDPGYAIPKEHELKGANRAAIEALSRESSRPAYAQLDPEIVGLAQRGFSVASTLASGAKEGSGNVFSRALGLLGQGFSSTQARGGPAAAGINAIGMSIMGLFTAVLGIDAIKTLFSKGEQGKSKWMKLAWEGGIALFAGNLARNFYEILNGATYPVTFYKKLVTFLIAKFAIFDAAFKDGSIANKLLGWAIKDSKGNNRLENILTLNFDSS